MSGFDEEKFRASAKAAGYSDEEINAELKSASAPVGAAVPNIVSIASGPETTAKFEAEAKAKQDELVQTAAQERTEATTTSPFDWQGILTSPAALVTGGAVLGALGLKATPTATEGIKKIKDRWLSAPELTPPVIDIPPATPINYEVPAYLRNPPAPIEAVPEAPPSRMEQLQQRAEAGRQAGLGAKAPVIAPQFPPAGAPAGDIPPVAPYQPSAQPKSGATQMVTETLTEELTGKKPVAPPVELRTGTGKVAYAGEGPAPALSTRTGQPKFKAEYESMKAVPQGYAVIPEGQYIDALRQDLGQAEYTKAFTGRKLPATYEEAIAVGKDINRGLGRATREEAKAAGLPYGEITPGITKKTTAGKKLVTIGGKAGMAGALVSLADLALADTAQNRMNAGVSLLGAVLPPGMDINEAGAPTVGSQQFSNAALLGSPYAQTEWAKTQRLKEKAGAGRGIAPPSAYQR